MVLLLAACAVACAGAPVRPLPTIKDIAITERGTDEPDAFCRDFNLTVPEARSFFSRAKVIDASVLHDRFEFLPCWVRGSGKVQGQPISWEIRAGGTAIVRWPDHHAVQLGCRECLAGFK